MSIRKKKLHLDSKKPLNKTKLESKSSVLGSLVDNYKSDDELSDLEDQAYANFMKEIEQTDNTNNEERNKESVATTEELWYQSYDDNTKHTYYYNPKTNKSVWVLPEGAKLADQITEKTGKVLDETTSCLSESEPKVDTCQLSDISDEVEEVLYIDNGSEEIEKNQTSSDKNNEILEEKAPSVSGDDEKCYSDSQTGENEKELKSAIEPIVSPSKAEAKLTKITRHELRELYESNCEKCQIFESGLHPIQYTYIQMQARFEDWKLGELQDDYFHKKVVEDLKTISEFEKKAAPVGYTCNWNREQRRYYYTNNMNENDSYWMYPPNFDGSHSFPSGYGMNSSSTYPHYSASYEPEVPLPPGEEQPPLPSSNTDKPPLPPMDTEKPPLPPMDTEKPPLPPMDTEKPPLPPIDTEQPPLPSEQSLSANKNSVTLNDQAKLFSTSTFEEVVKEVEKPKTEVHQVVPLERGPVNYSSDAKMIPKSAIKRSGSNEPSRAVKNKLAKTAKKQKKQKSSIKKPHKKVGLLINKWASEMNKLKEEEKKWEAESSEEECSVEKWKRDQIISGAAHSNPNFMPVGDGWKKKIKRK